MSRAKKVVGVNLKDVAKPIIDSLIESTEKAALVSIREGKDVLDYAIERMREVSERDDMDQADYVRFCRRVAETTENRLAAVGNRMARSYVRGILNIMLGGISSLLGGVMDNYMPIARG